MSVPIEVVKVAAQYLSGHTDGFAKQGYRKQLEEMREEGTERVREYVDAILEKGI